MYGNLSAYYNNTKQGCSRCTAFKFRMLRSQTIRQYTDYRVVFRDFTPFLRTNTRIDPEMETRTLPSVAFQFIVHYRPSFNAINSTFLTGLFDN